MANRFYSPNQQFSDNTGLPYSGGSLAFYASGTSTPLATYSDSALSSANTNPVVLDSAGRAGNIFLQNLAYKVVLSDVNSNVIWTDDPVYSSDYSTRAKFLTGSGSPNGNTAGTAGSTGIGSDTYWDSTNLILYVCTQTGTSSTAVWTAVNSATAAAVVPPPQGYLTLATDPNNPILTGDSLAASTVYYTPYVGNLLPIFNGTSFSSVVFSQIQLALTASQTGTALFDVFAFNNLGVVTLVVGPTWASSAAGSSSRGSGAGTTQLTRISGIWVNAVSMSAKNGANTYTVPANQATYLGSIYIDSAAGQVSCYRTWGQSRKWGVWNAYNRKAIVLLVGDGTASWNNNSAAVRPANNNAANSCTIFSGLAEEPFSISNSQLMNLKPDPAAAGFQYVRNGIGLNSISAFSGSQGLVGFNSAAGGIAVAASSTATAVYVAPPQIGISTVTAMEQGNATINVTATFNGTQPFFYMNTAWMG